MGEIKLPGYEAVKVDGMVTYQKEAKPITAIPGLLNIPAIEVIGLSRLTATSAEGIASYIIECARRFEKGYSLEDPIARIFKEAPEVTAVLLRNIRRIKEDLAEHLTDYPFTAGRRYLMAHSDTYMVISGMVIPGTDILDRTVYPPRAYHVDIGLDNELGFPPALDTLLRAHVTESRDLRVVSYPKKYRYAAALARKLSRALKPKDISGLADVTAQVTCQVAANLLSSFVAYQQKEIDRGSQFLNLN